jgi:transcriptional regulator with XRE-family HTH domain
MVTKSPPVHVLRTVRKLYGLSQQKLANLVGCSLTGIKQIETNRLRPGPDLAHRIYMQTGLDPGQLMENSFPETPFHAMGMPLTKDTFKWMQERHEEGQTQRHVDESLHHIQAVLEILLDASTRHGKLWALRPALQNAIGKLIKDFALEKDFVRLLSARFDVKDPWSNANPGKSLYTIVNTERFRERRKRAAKRSDFYELKQLKHHESSGPREPGKRSPKSNEVWRVKPKIKPKWASKDSASPREG